MNHNTTTTTTAVTSYLDDLANAPASYLAELDALIAKAELENQKAYKLIDKIATTSAKLTFHFCPGLLTTDVIIDVKSNLLRVTIEQRNGYAKLALVKIINELHANRFDCSAESMLTRDELSSAVIESLLSVKPAISSKSFSNF